MKKIGFIDNFLSEWHANNYPEKIRRHPLAQQEGIDVCYAYAKTEVSPYDGVSTDEWCAKYGVKRFDSIEELVNLSDCIVVLSPDNPELHEELSAYALKSGKPVYIDKTFAPDKFAAQRIFNLANEYGTPVYSSSALRFATELKQYRQAKEGAKSCVAVGPYLFEIYAIHIFEMMCAVMKGGAKRMLATEHGRNRIITVDYGGGRTASFVQFHTDDDGVPFEISVEQNDGTAKYHLISGDYFDNFIDGLVNFFVTGIPQADSRETVDLIAMLDCAQKALANPYVWVEI